MSVQHFIQTIWSKKIQDDLEEKCKLVADCTREYQGDVKYARTVKILGVGDPSIGNYTGADINIEKMSDSSQDLVIDVQKYFAFQVDDVDQAQSVPGLPQKYQQKAMQKLAVNREHFIGALVAGKAQSTADEVAGNTTYKPGCASDNIVTAKTNAQKDVKKAIDDALVGLRENNFDDSGVIEITPRVYQIFKDQLIEMKTANDDMIKRGVVGQYDGFEVKSTNNVYKDSTHSYNIVRSRNAIAFAGQIDKVEAGRMEKRFADYIRGLDVYGAKIIAPKELFCVKVPL